MIRMAKLLSLQLKLDTSCNLSQTGPPRRVDCLALLWEYRRSVFPEDKTTHCPVQKPRVDKLTVVTMRSYQLNCIAASWDISVKCLSQGYNSKLCITIWRSDAANIFHNSILRKEKQEHNFLHKSPVHVHKRKKLVSAFFVQCKNGK